MNINAAYRYQLRASSRSILTFFAIYWGVLLVVFLPLALLHPGTQSSNGAELSTIIFLFVLGLCSFKENFGMLMQNGVSRRSFGISHIAVAASIALAAAVADKLFLSLYGFIASASGTFRFSTMFEWSYSGSGLGWQLTHLAYSFAGYFFMLTVGFFISLLLYRLNGLGKTLVGAGVPVLLFVALPIVDGTLFDGKIIMALTQFWLQTQGLPSNQPWLAVLSNLLASALFAALSWLLLRRATVKG